MNQGRGKSPEHTEVGGMMLGIIERRAVVRCKSDGDSGGDWLTIAT